MLSDSDSDSSALSRELHDDDGYLVDREVQRRLTFAREAQAKYTKLLVRSAGVIPGVTEGDIGGVSWTPKPPELAPIETLPSAPPRSSEAADLGSFDDALFAEEPKSAAEAAKKRIRETKRARAQYDAVQERIEEAERGGSGRVRRRKSKLRQRKEMTADELRLKRRARMASVMSAIRRLEARGEGKKRGAEKKGVVGLAGIGGDGGDGGGGVRSTKKELKKAAKEYEKQLLLALDTFDVFSVHGLNPLQAAVLQSLGSRERTELLRRVADKFLSRVRKAVREYRRRRRRLDRRKVFGKIANATRTRSMELSRQLRKIAPAKAPRLDAVRLEVLAELMEEREVGRRIAEMGGEEKGLAKIFAGTAFQSITQVGKEDAALSGALPLGHRFVQGLAKRWGERVMKRARSTIRRRKEKGASPTKDDTTLGLEASWISSTMGSTRSMKKLARATSVPLMRRHETSDQQQSAFPRTIDPTRRSQPVWQPPPASTTEKARKDVRSWAIGAGIVDEGAALAAPLAPDVEQVVGLHLPRIPLAGASQELIQLFESMHHGAPVPPDIEPPALIGTVPRPSASLATWAASSLSKLAESERAPRAQRLAKLTRPTPAELAAATGPADPADREDAKVIDELMREATKDGEEAGVDEGGGGDGGGGGAFVGDKMVKSERDLKLRSGGGGMGGRGGRGGEDDEDDDVVVGRRREGKGKGDHGFATRSTMREAEKFEEEFEYDRVLALRTVARGAGKPFGLPPPSSLLPRPDALERSGVADFGIRIGTSGDSRGGLEKLTPGIQGVVKRYEERLEEALNGGYQGRSGGVDPAASGAENMAASATGAGTKLASRRWNLPASRGGMHSRRSKKSTGSRSSQILLDLPKGMEDDRRQRRRGRWWEDDSLPPPLTVSVAQKAGLVGKKMKEEMMKQESKAREKEKTVLLDDESGATALHLDEITRELRTDLDSKTLLLEKKKERMEEEGDGGDERPATAATIGSTSTRSKRPVSRAEASLAVFEERVERSTKLPVDPGLRLAALKPAPSSSPRQSSAGIDPSRKSPSTLNPLLQAAIPTLRDARLQSSLISSSK